MNANTQVKTVTEHGFSAHSRRPWDCRICKLGAQVHATASPESEATWRNANTADVTARMKGYGDRTVNALRTLASLPQITQWDLGKGRGLHATAVKILTTDGILVNTMPGETAAIWEISPVGAQLCFHFGIEITQAETEISVPVNQAAECICSDIMEAGAAGLPMGGRVCPGCGSVFTVEGTEASAEILAESGRVVAGKATSLEFIVDESDIAEANAQAWAEAGSPRDAQGQPVIPTPAEACTLCGRTDTLGRDDQVTPFPHECVTAAQAEAFRFPRVFTDHDMRDQVTRYLEESGLVAERACVTAIVDTLQEACGTVDIDTIDEERFNAVIDFHMSTIEESPEDIPTNAEVDALMAEHDAAMAEWVKPLLPALPVRTPGAAWAGMECEIWAGTDQVERMRFPRKMKKSLRKFATAQMGMAMPRPIKVKHARIAAGAVR